MPNIEAMPSTLIQLMQLVRYGSRIDMTAVGSDLIDLSTLKSVYARSTSAPRLQFCTVFKRISEHKRKMGVQN